MLNPNQTQTARTITSVALLLISLLTLADLMEDRAKGAGWGHLITESIIVVAAVSSLMYLWWSTIWAGKESHQQISKELSNTRVDLETWRSKARELLSGLGNAIDEQFSEWSLTDAEKEVGPAQRSKWFGTGPVRLGDNTHTEAMGFEDPADDRHPEARMIHVGITRHNDDITAWPGRLVPPGCMVSCLYNEY